MNKYIEVIKQTAIEARKGIFLASILAVFFCLCACGQETLMKLDENVILEESESVGDEEAAENITEEDGSEDEPAEIYVHICGAVNNPGVYALNEGGRIMDCVVAAGGFDSDAASDAVNLAAAASDGERIYIPTYEELQTGQVEVSGTLAAAEDTDRLININTAGEDKLTSINGIGPSRAQAIIEYRESHGAFKSIEDITQVSGIGDSTLEKIRDQITVN